MKTIVHCNNVCWLGGTALFALDMMRMFPEFKHKFVYFYIEDQSPIVVEQLNALGVEHHHIKYLDGPSLDNLKPDLLILNNVSDRNLTGEWPFSYLNKYPSIFIHHNPTRPIINCDADVFVSEFVRESYTKFLPKLKGEHLIVNPCIDTSKYVTIERPQRQPVIGKLSSDSEDKFPPTLLPIIEGVKVKHEAVFNIVGGKKYKVDAADITPDFGSKTPAGFYQDFDIFFHHNVPAVKESWGRTITEAMASGLPVVVDGEGGPKEQVIHGETGFLCKNPGEFVEYLSMLLQDDTMRLEMGKKAREHAVKNFDSSQIRNRLLPIINKLTGCVECK